MGLIVKNWSNFMFVSPKLSKFCFSRSKLVKFWVCKVKFCKKSVSRAKFWVLLSKLVKFWVCKVKICKSLVSRATFCVCLSKFWVFIVKIGQNVGSTDQNWSNLSYPGPKWVKLRFSTLMDEMNLMINIRNESWM